MIEVHVSTRRKIGKYPCPEGNTIATAKASYEDGYQCGLTWDSTKHPWTPGGPWVCGRSRYDLNNDPDWKRFCEATFENHEEWLRGWRDGHAHKEPTPPEMNLDTLAVLGYN